MSGPEDMQIIEVGGTGVPIPGDDVVAEQIRYGDRTVDVEVDDAMREALVEGIWDTTELMYRNLDRVRETAAGLPYVESAE